MHQLITIIRNTLSVFFRSFFLIPFNEWLSVWFLRGKEQIVTLDSLKVIIRTEKWSQKIVDLFMAVYCIADKEYFNDRFKIRDTDVVVDIGGHIGAFSLIGGQRAFAGRVLVFEPDILNYVQLLKNLAINNLVHVEARNEAVGKEDGNRVLYSDSLNSAKSSLSRATETGRSVKIVSLPRIFEEHKIERCNFLKMDCEGAEYEILFNTPLSLLSRIENMVLEVHNPSYFGLTEPNYRPSILKTFLEEAGFTLTVKKEDLMHDIYFASRR